MSVAPYPTYEYPRISSDHELHVAELQMVSAMAGGAPDAPNLLETHDKQADELEIRNGEQVMLGHSGTKLGEVSDVLLDEGELIGIVVKSTRFFGPGEVILQVRFLGRSDDAALFARLTPAQLEQLPPFYPDPD